MITVNNIPCMLSRAALYEQLAEECSELAHAALKMARIFRDENPTPRNSYDVLHLLEEEFTDLNLVADVLGLKIDDDIYKFKLERWYRRLKEHNNV